MLRLSKYSSWQPPSMAETKVSEVKGPTRGVFYIMSCFVSGWWSVCVCVYVCDVTKALRFKDEWQEVECENILPGFTLQELMPNADLLPIFIFIYLLSAYIYFYKWPIFNTYIYTYLNFANTWNNL